MQGTIDIAPELVVNDAIRRFPATVTVFNTFGIDACCGGDRTIAAAAAEDGASLDELLAALRRAVEEQR